MFVVHWTNWGPRISGMYESVKDQIKYERAAGIKSEFGNPHEDPPSPEQVDDWLTPITWEQAKKADVWVLHSKFPDSLKTTTPQIAKVAVLHGPTEHMILKEWTKSGGDFNLHINLLWEMDATVCINTHEYDVMKHYDEKKGRCHFIPNSIDLDKFKDVKPWKYDNHPAIISCDTPRVEKLPIHIVWAMPYLNEIIPEAKLNVYSLLLEPINIWRNFFCRSQGRKLEKCCENIQLASNSLSPFQMGADIGFNNNYSGIASRVTMEMQAMGTPVVSYNGEYTPYHAKIFDVHSIAETIAQCWKDMQDPKQSVVKDTIKYAKANYDRAKHIPKFLELYETVKK